MNDQFPNQEYGPLYWTGVAFALAALTLLLWPWYTGELAIRLLTVIVLILTSGILLYVNIRDQSALARRQYWVNYLFMIGFIYLPLQSTQKLPWYVVAPSMAALVAAIYLNWQLHRDRKLERRRIQTPPPE